MVISLLRLLQNFADLFLRQIPIFSYRTNSCSIIHNTLTCEHYIILNI